MLQPQPWTQRGFPPLVLLLCLLAAAAATTVPLTFITSIAGTVESGSIVLTAGTLSTSSGFTSGTATLTFLNSYSSAPQFGYGFSFISAQWPMTTSATETVFDVNVSASNQFGQDLQLTFTAGSVSLFSINYLACASSFFLDIRNSYHDLTATTLFSTSLASTRSLTINLPAKTKSNSSNTVAAYTTAGLSMMRAKGTFEFQLATLGYSSTTINVNLTLTANNGMRFIRFAIFNYEAVVTVIASPYFIDIGLGANLGGTVPDSSALGLTTTGTIFLGMTDWALTDYFAAISYNMSLAGTVYSLSGSSPVTRTQTAFVWYRQAVCPTYYFNQSNVCAPCHVSCVTCLSAAATACTSCDSVNSFRTHLSSNLSCPCIAKYVDTGSAICQQVLCYDYCSGCSANNYCTGCNSGTYRSLVNGSCVCQSYTIDFYAVDPDQYATCQLCFPTCLTCSDMFSRFACTSCSLARDHRSFNADLFTCDCADGYFENPNTTTKTFLYYYKGVPCLPCAVSCATCTGNTSCLTCNASLNRIKNQTTQLCSCQTGFYDTNLLQTCFPCPFSCLACTSATVCLACHTTRALTNNLCPCKTGFYESNVAACQACNYTCLTCTSSSNCATCNSAFFRSMSNGSCVCGTGYYDVFGSPICLTCDPSCLGCSGPAADACTSCSSAAFRTLTPNKTCACVTGYYLNPDTNTCSPCGYTCESCADGISCASCSGTNFRYLSGSSCLCQNKYYNDGGNQLCKSCMYFCLTCSSSAACLTCDSTRNSSNLATCPCLSQFYDDGISASCQPCLASCLTCANANNCTSCAANRVITLEASCVCKPRTYEPYCSDCAYSCLACLAASTTCTSCNGTSMRYLDLNSSQCVCYQGFYDDVATQNEVCQPCHFSCLTCSSADSCLTCPVNRASNGSFCSCISTFYQNSQNLNCLPCHYSCLTCSSYSVCSSCDAAANRISSANSTLCLCAGGYYDNLVSALCIACDSVCMACSSFTLCTACNATLNFYYSNGTCLCNTGYYFDSGTRKCVGCNYSCNTCLLGTACATCKQNRTLTASFCACNAGLFDHPATQTCSPCTYPCLTCTNSSTNCTSCDSSRTLNTAAAACLCAGSTYDAGLNCSSCLATCQTCATAATCITCLPGSNRTLNGNSLCVCPAGFHDENGTVLSCAPCDYSCASCINSVSCSTCYSGRSSIVGGFCACPAEHYYDNGVNPQCIACAVSCLTCAGISTNCTSCLAATFRSLLNATCTCQPGYYDDLVSAACRPCHYSCQECTGPSSCTLCNSTNRRYNIAGPLCSCGSGFFDVSNEQLCSACSYSCATCVSSAALCLSCPATRTLLNASSSCPCADGYYDAAAPACLRCHYSCATCTNGATCLSCPATRLPSVAQACLCEPGSFDALQPACSPCAPTCLECSAYQVCTLCDTANTHRQLANTTCACPAGYYDASFSSNYTCQSCSYSCATCVSALQCTSCNANYQRVYNFSTSLCSCVAGFYDDGSHAPCSPCPYDCLTCAGPTTCLACSSVRQLVGGRCACVNATYDNGTSCESCPVECPTCLNSSHCTSCAAARTLASNACPCPAGLYSVAGTATCSPCHYSCSSCLSESQCSTCNATLKRYPTSTLCLCAAGFFDDGQNMTCRPCSYSCLLCASATACLSCSAASNRIYNSNSSLCDCVSGYYQDPATKACVQCQLSCVSCSNGSACSSCNPNFNRELDSASQCTCLAVGFFDTFLSPVCSNCHYSCLSCAASAAFCTSCSNATMRILSASACVCRNGYYDAPPQTICLTCSVRCVTCQGAGDNCTQCSAANYRGATPNCSCITGFYDNSSAVCAACHYACLSCVMAQACSSCDLNTSHRALNAASLCDCVGQFYDNGTNICLACNYSCLTCSAHTFCLSCPASRLLTASQCPCRQKYYDDLASLECLACDYSCQSCRNASSCFSCDAALSRAFNSSSLMCSCLEGYFDTGLQAEQCSRCHPSCYSCVSASACLACPPNINKTLNASSGSNYCVCLYGYFENVAAGAVLGYSSVCNPCYFACQTCANQASYCTLCLNASNRYLTSSHECACNTGTFEIAGQQTCISCYAHCLTCRGTSNSSCLTCDNATYFLNNSCYTACPQFYNVSAATRTCASCPQNCLSCAASFTVCSQCSSPYFIFAYNSSFSLCVDSCPSLYYQLNSTCYPCLAPCLACTAAYTCASCVSLYYLAAGRCSPCHALCLTCNGSTALDCLACVPNYILRGSVCQKLACLPTQYVHSVAGCLACAATFPNSLACLSTGPTSCLNGYILANASCLACAAVPGYSLNSATGKCQDFCGDGITITDLCDDGNNLNGDGCSAVCTIESGWTCPNSSCSLLAQPTVTVVSMANAPLTHTITLIISLSVGLRLVAANFLLSFSSITRYTYSLAALDSSYKAYRLTVVYYETAANNNLNIQIRSPISRLLVTTDTALSLSISLSLSVTVPVVTNPPAIYVSQQTSEIYSKYLLGVIAALHVVLLLVAGVFLAMRLKVMLLVIDALNSLAILYVLAALGMFGVSLLSYETGRGLQPFLHSFGSPLPSASSLSYFGYSSNFFGTSIIQAGIIGLCFLLSAYFSRKDPSEDENHWHYYRVGFGFAFSYDLLLSCFSTFFWNSYNSYESAYSWMFALLFLIYLCAQGAAYYARTRDSTGEGKRVVPAVSFITNELEIRDRGKEGNIFEFDEEASKEKEKRKGILSERSDEQTEGLEAAEAEPKQAEEAVRYYDLTPSAETQYSMSNSNHISAAHLPIHSLLFPLAFAVVANVQTASARSALFLALSLLHLLSILLTRTSTLKSLRNIKLITLSTIYLLLSCLALASSLNPQTTDLLKMDAAIVSLVLAALLWNLVALVGGVLKSETYREYLINRKNAEIMERTKKQNETRMKIYTKDASKDTNKPIKANTTNVFLEEPESFEARHAPPADIQLSEEQAEEKEMRLSALKKRRRDEPTMLQGNSSSINQHIDHEVSDFNNSDFRPPSDLLNDKHLEGNKSPEPRSPSKKQGNRIKAINSSALSLVSRKGETPSLFFENSLQRIDEFKGVKRNLDKSEEKEEVEGANGAHRGKSKSKRKKKPNVGTDVIGKEEEEEPRQPKQRMAQKLQPRDSGEVLQGILEDMDGLPTGFKKAEDNSFRARIMSIDGISSIQEEREQFAMQEQEYEGSVFNKILHDYQKYKYKKVDKKKLNGKKVEKNEK